MYYFPLNLYIVLLAAVFVLTVLLAFINDNVKRIILTSILTVLTGILASVLFVNMVGDYHLDTYTIFENTFLSFVLFALTLIYAGITVVLAYQQYGKNGSMLDTRRFDL